MDTGREKLFYPRRGRRRFFLFRDEAVGCKEAGVCIQRPRPNQRVRKTRSVFSTISLFSIITFLTWNNFWRFSQDSILKIMFKSTATSWTHKFPAFEHRLGLEPPPPRFGRTREKNRLIPPTQYKEQGDPWLKQKWQKNLWNPSNKSTKSRHPVLFSPTPSLCAYEERRRRKEEREKGKIWKEGPSFDARECS